MNSKSGAKSETSLWSDNSAVTIELLNSENSYKPGEAVEGRVLVKPTNFENLKGASINIRGIFSLHKEPKEYFANATGMVKDVAQWVASEASKEPQIRKTFLQKGNEDSCKTGRQLSISPVRVHEYLFKFTLPVNIPSSFESNIERVSYIVNAEVQKVEPCREPRLFKSLPLTVTNPPVDTNDDPKCSKPIHIREIKEGNLLKGRTGDIGFSIKLPRGSGFVVGEKVDIIVEVSNHSNMKITGMKAWIDQTITQVEGLPKHNTEKNRIVVKVKGQVNEHGDATWIPTDLIIPHVPPTTTKRIPDYVDIQYALHVKVDVSGFTKPLSATVPLIIWEVPLRSGSEVAAQLPAESAPSAHSKEDECNKVDEPNGSYKESAPPSYDQVTMTSQNGAGTKN